MAVLTFIPESEKPTQKPPHSHSKRKRNKQQPHRKPKEILKQPSSWDQVKNMFTCKQIEDSKIHDPSSKNPNGYSKLGSCSSICSFRDVVNGNTRVVHRADNSPETSSVGQETRLLNRKQTHVHHGSTSGSSASSRSLGCSTRSNGGGQGNNKGGSRGMQLRKLSGCYECHAVLEASASVQIMIINYKLAYPSGTATAVLINGFHTEKGDKMAKKQVHRFMKFFSASFNEIISTYD